MSHMENQGWQRKRGQQESLLLLSAPTATMDGWLHFRIQNTEMVAHRYAPSWCANCARRNLEHPKIRIHRLDLHCDHCLCRRHAEWLPQAPTANVHIDRYLDEAPYPYRILSSQRVNLLWVVKEETQGTEARTHMQILWCRKYIRGSFFCRLPEMNAVKSLDE